MNKFSLNCKLCNKSMLDFSEWFGNNQRCPKCGEQHVEVTYRDLIERLVKTFSKNEKSLKGMWRYFDVLPLNSTNNIVTAGEGNVAIEKWQFLETFAQKYFGINCQVYAHRNDNNNATGSFKDLAGSMVASVLSENNIKHYVVASTGNIGVAFSRYISKYNGTLYVFIPEKSPLFKEAEIGIFGQRVFRVLGDYTSTKRVAEEFSIKNKILLTAGTFDPMRIEAKKTMAFEWFRQMKKFPNVYLQALSGGTGPLGVVKGCHDLIAAKLIKKVPRLILVQSDKCAPMADAWKLSKTQGFPSGWQHQYPIYENPNTEITTLATGNPLAYPILAKYVKDTCGEIIDFPEEIVPDLARIIACETAARLGPAAVIAVGGFFSSLRQGLIHPNDIVLINIGEGIRRDPEFMVRLNQEIFSIRQSADCLLFDRNKYRESTWSKLKDYILT